MIVSDRDRGAAAELVDAWETSGKGYGYLEDRIAEALATARSEGRVPETTRQIRCSECGAGGTDVHRRDCTSKRGKPMADGGIPWGGACDSPGCRYADMNVRHVHRVASSVTSSGPVDPGH